jgi:lysine-N-methylase
MQKDKLLIPQYVKEFSCIGSECEDSCCVGWKIDIDIDTYKKYKNIKGSHKLKTTLDKSIKKNRTSTCDSNYAKIKLKKDGRCPILDENNLCNIHSQFGKDYLSYTCTVYPRYVNIVDERTELSLSMSCPEAARLALFNKELMSFDETEDTDNARNLAKQSVVTHGKGDNHLNYYFWELRIFTISLLQNRDYTISERLILLGMFYQKVQNLIDNNLLNEIPKLIEENKIKIGQKSQNRFSQIPKTTDIQIQLVKSILDASSSVNNKRFLECLSDFMDGLKQGKDEIQDIDEVVNRYEECYDKYYQTYMEENEFILENYLVNYVYKNMFPLNNGYEVFKSYCLLTIHYSIIKVLLIGVSGYHEKLTNDIVLKVIQSFGKVIEHNGPFLTAILKKMEEKDYLTMAYMAVLIKN